MNLQQAIAEFLEHGQTVRNLSDRTLRAYQSDLSQFHHHVSDTRVDDITADDLDLAHLLEDAVVPPLGQEPERRHDLELVGGEPFGLDPGQPVAKAALDLAAHDLVCRKLGINLQSWLGAKGADRIELSWLVSAPDVEGTAKSVEQGLAEGYRAFKVKVGHEPKLDIERVRKVLELAKGSTVWPDANQGYTLADALAAARGFEALGIELFEQPIPMSDFYGMKKLLSATRLTICLDEAAMGLPLVIDLIRREAVEGLVIKVNKTGGIHYARQLCDLARNAGLRLIGSGLMDAPIGFAASVHLFAAYGIDYPCDLNGPQHIAADYLAEPLPREGRFALVPQRPGLGVVMDEGKVASMSLKL